MPDPFRGARSTHVERLSHRRNPRRRPPARPAAGGPPGVRHPAPVGRAPPVPAPLAGLRRTGPTVRPPEAGGLPAALLAADRVIGPPNPPQELPQKSSTADEVATSVTGWGRAAGGAVGCPREPDRARGGRRRRSRPGCGQVVGAGRPRGGGPGSRRHVGAARQPRRPRRHEGQHRPLHPHRRPAPAPPRGRDRRPRPPRSVHRGRVVVLVDPRRPGVTWLAPVARTTAARTGARSRRCSSRCSCAPSGTRSSRRTPGRDRRRRCPWC